MGKVEFDLTIEKDWWIEYGLIKIPKQYRYLFPPPGGEVVVVYDKGKINTRMHKGWKGQDVPRIDGLTKFYNNHPEVTVGSIIRVTIEGDGVVKLTPISAPIKERGMSLETKQLELPPSHTEIQTMVREIGELIGLISRVEVRYSEAEYKIDKMRLDVVWKAIRGGDPKFAFEVHLSGNVVEALGKIKHALDRWSSKPCLVSHDEGIQQARELLQGMFHEMENKASLIHWKQIVELHKHLKEVERLLKETNLLQT